MHVYVRDRSVQTTVHAWDKPCLSSFLLNSLPTYGHCASFSPLYEHTGLPHSLPTYRFQCFYYFFIFYFLRSPAISLGFTTFWVRFLRMWPFFNPTIKVVTFRLRGWCVLGVFLLLAFTRLGHERQDLLSLWWNGCVHRLDLDLCSPEEDRTRDTVDSEPMHYQLSYSGPPVFL